MKLLTRYGLALLASGLTLAQPYVISTVAGSVAPQTPVVGTKASVGYVPGVVTDSAGNVYFFSGLGCIFKLDTKGVMTRIAGTCRSGYSGDGASALNAQLFAVDSPRNVGMAIDSAGNLYFVDGLRIRKVSTNGIINTVAGNGTGGFAGDGGPATAAQLADPYGLAIDLKGNLYVTDGQRIREILASNGTITTIAGGMLPGYAGDGEAATKALFSFPQGLATDAAGDLYIADAQNDRVRMISPAGIITTVAGNGNFGPSVNGALATNSPVGYVTGVAVDSGGNLYTVDQQLGNVRKISANGTIATIAGPNNSAGGHAFAGDGEAASSALFNNPIAVALDPSGNIYIADPVNCRLREINALNMVINTVAGNGWAFSGDGGQALDAQVFDPQGIALDASGNLYIADYLNYRIRKVAPGGTITTIAGTGALGYSGDQSQAVNAELDTPYGMAVDSAGDIYFSDSYNNVIRMIAPGGVITTVAGNGKQGPAGDGQMATSAELNLPQGIALDQAGNLYVADLFNYKVRQVAPNGIITTVAGNGQQGNTGDGGQAIDATLGRPTYVAVDSKGNLYISDLSYGRIRKVTPGGAISTFALTNVPYGLTFDAQDNLYAGGGGAQILKISPSGVATPIAGTGVVGYSGDGGIAANALLNGSSGVAVDSQGDVYFADPGANVVRLLTPDPPTGLTISGGNNQTGQVGWTLPNPLQVVVNGRAGVPVPGVTVNFAVTSGSATLSSASAVTDSTGTASVQLTLGANPGNVVVTATAAGTNLAPVLFHATTIAAPAGGGITCTISAAPSITSVNSATDFGGLSSFAPGSWLEVKGSNLAVDTRLWSGSDFQGSNAPTGLDSSRVSIDGNAGFVYYISGGQINVQAPADSATGPVKITVTTCAGTSAAVTAQEASLAPGMLAPASFNVGGKQYLAALFQDGATFVGNASLIAGVPFQPAKPGDSITAYGIGFGAVTPAIAPGVVVGQQNNIPNLTVSFGATSGSTTLATLTYAGLAPGNIGLYQFNITVPQVADGDYQINVSAGGVQAQQALYLTVHQ